MALLSLFASGATFAATKAEISKSADQALTRFYALNPANQALVGKAAGVLIFGYVTKAGVGVGGEYGEGSCRSRVTRLITTASHPPRLDSRSVWRVIEKSSCS